MPSREELVKARIDPDAYVEHDRGWYDGSIRAMDVEIGRAGGAAARRSAWTSRTLLVFTGDHGEEFFEHGRMFHGQSVYGELNNMPLIFWGPGPRAARARPSSETVQTVDLMPTLLELSGLPVPEGVQGHSLVPLLSGGASGGAARCGPRPRSRPAISEKAATTSLGGPPPRDTGRRRP